MFSPTANYRHGRPTEVGYTPPATAVNAGDVVVFNKGVRIAHSDIAVGILGALAIGFGIYDVPKASTGGSAIAAGTAVYWDSGNVRCTTTATGNYWLGITVNTSVDGDTTQRVLHLPPAFAFSLTNASITDNTTGVAGNSVASDVATTVITIPIPSMSALANGQVLNIDPGFAGKITAVNFRIGASPVTTAAKAATLTAHCNGVAVTGGVAGLTSANCTPAGAQVAGSAITAGNTFTAAQPIGVSVSGVTAFVEGTGFVELTVVNTDQLAGLATILAQLNAVTAILAGEA